MLEVLREGVDELVGMDPAELSDPALADQLLAARREMDRLDAAFARLAHAAHRRGIGAMDGDGSTAAWLRHRAQMREGDARAAVEAGEVCDLLADAGAAWRAGEITSGSMRTIVGARVKGHDEELVECEPILLQLARSGDLRSLRRAAGHFRNLARADGSPPGTHDGLHLSRAYGGHMVLSGELTDLAAETVATAIHAYTDPPGKDDDRTNAQRRAAALVRVCQVALEHFDARNVPAETGARVARRGVPHASLVIDWASLTEGRLGRCDGEFTGPIPPADVRRLLCDCSISRIVTGPDGLPLDVGRARRTFTPAMRRALVARDLGCKFPGCDRPPGWCEAHHVVHFLDGGPTAVENGVLYCDRHHQVVHQPGWTEKFDGHALHVSRPDGTEVT